MFVTYIVFVSSTSLFTSWLRDCLMGK
jgi:hypothetical protein